MTNMRPKTYFLRPDVAIPLGFALLREIWHQKVGWAAGTRTAGHPMEHSMRAAAPSARPTRAAARPPRPGPSPPPFAPVQVMGRPSAYVMPPQANGSNGKAAGAANGSAASSPAKAP